MFGRLLLSRDAAVKQLVVVLLQDVNDMKLLRPHRQMIQTHHLFVTSSKHIFSHFHQVSLFSVKYCFDKMLVASSYLRLSTEDEEDPAGFRLTF